MGIVKELYGKTRLGYDVFEYTLKNSNGMEVSILDFGCAITKISVPDIKGRFDNVVLKHDNLNGYEENPGYVGCSVGRYAGRISNGVIKIDDTEYHLDKNNINNTLHGGFIGFGRAIWKVVELKENPLPQVKLNYFSRDREGGFPGNLNVSAVFSLGEDNSLNISYEVISDKKTALSLTNHSYFNLSGKLDQITDHNLKVINPKILELNSDLVITGKTLNLNDYGLRLGSDTTVKEYMEVLRKVSPFQGIDHPFVIAKDGTNLVLAAEYSHKESGRSMKVFTNLPYMNIYSGSFLNSEVLINSKPYSGICFETQEQPDGPNKQELGYEFLEANVPYVCTTLFRFGTK